MLIMGDIKSTKPINLDDNSIEVNDHNKNLPSITADKASLILTDKALLAKIIDAENKDELQQQLDLFNMNQSKKNALRVVKLNSFLEKIEDQAIDRFEKRPDQISNKELLDYITTISSQVEKAQKSVDSLSTAPTITIAPQKTDVTINVGQELSRDGKERVMSALASILDQLKPDSGAIVSEITVDNQDDSEYYNPENEGDFN